MFQRPLFWLGLLSGGLFAFGSLRRQPATATNLYFDLIDVALIACDHAGGTTYINAPAQALFGLTGSGLTRLCYPTGQTVPAGQLPLSRALRSGKSVSGSGYRITAADGSVSILDIAARPLPGGGAAAVFRNTTAQVSASVREVQRQARHLAMQNLCRRLNTASDAEAIGRAVVEEVRLLLGSLPETQVRLYSYLPYTQALTRLASDPEDRPKRPKSAAQAAPDVFRFDAQVPALWRIYVDRQPSSSSIPSLGEAAAASAYALPLLAGGAAAGHLSMTSQAAGAFEDVDLQGILALAASLAAAALLRLQSADVTAAMEAQAEVLRGIVQAIAGGGERGQIADLVTRQVRLIIGCEVCTLSVPIGGTLSVSGEAFRDDLVFPERISPTAPVLHGKAVQKAWRTQKTVVQPGLPNPSFETGPWRAFAGKSGQHSVVAVPLASKRGVLTIFCDGASPPPDAQVKFLETAAALASMGLSQASLPEAPLNS